MPYSLNTAVANAIADKYNSPGYCLQQVRVWWGVAAKYGNAAVAWNNATQKHPGHRNPPRGAPVFWTGGAHGYGHVAISLGNGLIRHTDSAGRGRIGTTTLSWVENNWGLRYAGWTTSLNGVALPVYPPATAPATTNVPNAAVYGAGRVYLSKLKMGQTSSDSVRNLQARLKQLGLLSVNPTGNYAALTDAAVRAHQSAIGTRPDPAGRSYVGPTQAKRLFVYSGSPYRLY